MQLTQQCESQPFFAQDMDGSPKCSLEEYFLAYSSNGHFVEMWVI